MTGNTDKHRTASIRAAVIAIGIALVVVVAWLRFGGLSAERFTEAGKILPFPKYLTGTFGDSFGVLTALFSGLAFAGLVYTILLQRIELKETREVLKEQSESLRTQAMEATFFQLLQRFSQVARDVFFEMPGFRYEGRAAMTEYYGHLKRDIVEALDRARISNNDRCSQVESYLLNYGAQLNHYFRTLCHVFKFVDEHSALTPEQKVTYTKIARAQLSSPELSMIFYNGITGKGLEFHDLVQRYGLLEHVDRKALIHEDHAAHNVFYHLNSFKGSKDRRP
jgi:hypothetical protein